MQPIPGKMPELPEVETTRRALRTLVSGRQIQEVVVRNPRLRWPVSPELVQVLPGQVVRDLRRRAKYLLFDTSPGSLLIHLGMSGSLRVIDAGVPPEKHDHLDIVFQGARVLRMRDPRRFGAALWLPDAWQHPLLSGLGPEPLAGDAESLAQHLHRNSRGRKLAVKNFLMDSRVVVGVGNIYASESLFLAGVNPLTAAGRIGLGRWRKISDAIRLVLDRAIAAGGTTLRDFRQSDGNPGYFAQQLEIYGRAGRACNRCGELIKSVRIGQRSSFYCPRCQS